MARNSNAKFAVVAWLLLSLAHAVHAADDSWPEFRGPRGDGTSQAETAPLEWSETKNVRWKTAIHDRGWSSPIVMEGRIWLTTATADGRKMYVVAIDLQTGAVVHDLLLFEVAKPSEIHTFNSYASPTPAADGERVYAHFGSYGTACLDAKSGATLWQRRDLPCEHWRGPGSSVVLYDNLLLLHYDGYDVQYVVGLNKQTGATVWKTERAHDYRTTDGDIKKAFTTPTVIQVDGKPHMISVASKGAFAYDPRSGAELWRMRHDGFSPAVRPVYDGELVFFTTGHSPSELIAVRPRGSGDITDTNIAWRTGKSVSVKPSPLVSNHLAYMINDGGVASCLEADTGKEVWSKRLGDNYSASPVLAAGRLYFCSEEGKTTVIAADRGYQVLATNQLAEGCLGSPAVVGKALLMRTKTHLYRIEE